MITKFTSQPRAVVRASKSMLMFALILASFLARGEAAGNYSGTLWQSLDPKRIQASATDITAANYPDSDEATVEKKMVRVYRADGTGEAQDETFIKVLTEKGKRGNRTLSLGYMLPYYIAEVPLIEIVKPNGQVVAVDVEANKKETIDDSQMSMNIYDPNSKVLRVNIPGVEVGDIVHSIVRQTTQRSIIPGEFAEYNVFEGPGYIRHMSYEVHSPEDKPLKRIALRDEVKGTVKYEKQTEGKTTVHRWEVSNVPRMFDEPAMPSYEVVLQRLLVSTTPDWQTVSRWYWELSKPHLEATTPEMKQTAEELIAKAVTDLDKVKAIFYHVSKKIRYMGLTPEKDRPGYEPHDVSLTFGKKYGVCRDKAALLVSLLRAADLQAFPVLINVGTKKDAEVPEPFFNHAIVSVELTKGEYVLMDPTDENTRDLLPSGDCDQSYLVCRPEGEVIKVSPIKAPEENMMRVKTSAQLSANGTMQAHSELWFGGVNDNSYRQAFAHMKPDDKRHFFERALKHTMPGATLKSLKLYPEDMLDVQEEVRAELEFSVTGMTASGNGKSVVSLPWIGKGMGIVNFILGGTGLEKRKYPLQTYVACGLAEDLSIKLADGFGDGVSMPTYSPVEDRCLAYHEKAELKDKTLVCSRELKLKVVEFSPKEYLTLKRTLKDLEYDERKAPVLTISESAAATLAAAETHPQPPVESNARILESRKDVEIKDAHSSIYHTKSVKKILNYAGKIREAEVKIEFNPSIQEAKLLRAVVTSRSGEKQEISKDEINVMDAGWNASAKRYTGGKILVANLPGVDIGSTIEVEYELTTKGKPFLAGFETFQAGDELDKKTVVVTAPSDLKIENLVSGPKGSVTEERKTSDGKQTLTWHAENVKAMPAEPQLPPEWLFMPGVSYFAGDSKAYLSELNRMMLSRAQKSAKSAELAKELTKGSKSKEEALKAIRDYVAKTIRNAGPSYTELPLSELSDADTTLSDAYGHMADRAILLHALLTAAGFKPEFVLASGLPPISAITNVTASFPLPHSFQSPLVRVKVDDATYYLNDSDQYSHLGSTGYDGRLGIVLASQAFDVIKAVKDGSDKTETYYTMSMADNGKTRLGITRQFFGSHYNSRNRFFSELPPEERRRYYQEIVSQVAQGAQPVGELTTKFDVYPGVEEFTVDIDNYSVVDGKYLYFDLPFTPSLFPMGADERTLPLYISSETEHKVRTEIELPPGYRQPIIAPGTSVLSAPGGGGRASISSKLNSGKFVLTHDFETTPAIIEPKDYAAMLKLESTLEQKSSRVFLLQGETPPPVKP